MLKLYLISLAIFSQCIMADFIPNNVFSGELTSNFIGISPDGKYVAAGLTNKTTLVYQGGNVAFSYENDMPVCQLTVGSEFVAIANSGDNIDIFKLGTWEKLYTTTDSYYKYTDVKALKSSPDRKWLAVGSGYYIDFYTTEPFQLSQTSYQDGYKQLRDFAFSQDSLYLASSSPEGVQVSKLEQSWQMNMIIPAKGNDIVKVDFTHKHLVVCPGDNTVELYSIENNFALDKTITIPSGNVTQCSVQQNNEHLAVATDDGAVHLYKVGGDWGMTQCLEDFTSVNDLAFGTEKFVVDYQKKLVTFSEGSNNSASTLFVKFFLIAILSLLFI